MDLDYVFRDRPPTPVEFQQLRLALSTYRDGYGQQVVGVVTQPGWRDFERAVASVLGATAQENKGIFDVVVPVDFGLPYGISCKTKQEFESYVYMEMANSPAKFHARLEQLGIDPRTKPAAAGAAIVNLIREWHHLVDEEVDVDRSCYLVLTHDKTWQRFRLHWYDLEFHAPDRLDWSISDNGRCITGKLDGNKLWDWYPWSGGQLKYYPLIDMARWSSEHFALEHPPVETPAEKAARYWPDLWPDS